LETLKSTVNRPCTNHHKKDVSNSDIIYKPLPEDDPKQRCPDITKAMDVLKWQPKTMLNYGLDETIKYFCTKINE